MKVLKLHRRPGAGGQEQGTGAGSQRAAPLKESPVDAAGDSRPCEALTRGSIQSGSYQRQVLHSSFLEAAGSVLDAGLSAAFPLSRASSLAASRGATKQRRTVLRTRTSPAVASQAAAIQYTRHGSSSSLARGSCHGGWQYSSTIDPAARSGEIPDWGAPSGWATVEPVAHKLREHAGGTPLGSLDPG